MARSQFSFRWREEAFPDESTEADHVFRYARRDADRFSSWRITGDVPSDYAPEVHRHPDFPEVFGAVSSRPSTLHSNGDSKVVLRNCIFTAGSSLVLRRNRATFLGLHSRTEDFLESYESGERLLRITKRHLHLDCVRKREAQFVANEAVVLTGTYMNQWGHCFQDLLFRCIGIPDELRSMPVIVQKDTPANFLSMLRVLFGIERFILLAKGESVRIARAHVPLPRTDCPVGWNTTEDIYARGSGWSIDPCGVRQLQKQAAASRSRPKERYRRVYLRRPREAFRTVVNEEILYADLTAAGFESVYPETMSFSEIIDLLAETRVAVGVTGSQFLIAMLAEPGLKCVVITTQHQSPYVIPQGLLAAEHEVRLVGAKPVFQGARSPYQAAQAPIEIDSFRVLDYVA